MLSQGHSCDENSPLHFGTSDTISSSGGRGFLEAIFLFSLVCRDNNLSQETGSKTARKRGRTTSKEHEEDAELKERPINLGRQRFTALHQSQR